MLSWREGSAVAWWLMPRTPDPEVRGSSPTRVKPCCVLEQGTFTPKKVLVIPRKRWLRPNMTEKLFIGTLRINQPTNIWRDSLSRVMREQTFYICENKDADQLRGDREADQRLCFRYIDSKIPLLSNPKFQA